MLVNVYIVEYVYITKLCTIKNVLSVMLLSTYHKHVLNANDKHFRRNLLTAPFISNNVTCKLKNILKGRKCGNHAKDQHYLKHNNMTHIQIILL